MILTTPTKNNIDVWLHQEMIAMGGGAFKPADDWWRPDPTAQSANIAEAKFAVPEAMRSWLAAALAYYAKDNSARTLKQLAYVLGRCADLGVDVLDEADAIAIRNRLGKSEFSVLRVFLKRWREEYLLAVCPSEQVIKALYALKPKNTSGPCPVESMNPVKGPFTVRETQALFDWSNDAYANGRISIERFLYIRLLIATGARSRQLQQLVFGDLHNASEGPLLRIPKAKQKGFEYRNSFQTCKLAKDLYSLLVSYQSLTLNCLQADRPGVDWEKALPHVPIFRSKGKKFVHTVIINDPDLHLLEAGPQEKFHKHDGSMKALLYGLETDPAFPISERTGERIHLGPHRFRYTLGTDMSRMGFSQHTVALALGHKSIRSVSRYIKVSPEMGKRIDDKMKKELSLVVNAFKGKLVESAAEAVNGSYPNKTIRGQSSGIATCGASGGCHLDAPVACYTCSKFQPWIEGPHEEVLERLKLRQQRAIDAAGQDSNVAMSFDGPILAVMQVIHQVNAKRKNRKGENNE
ncbi:site-specific integrase [Halomonas sp. M4R1S46]|uniref:site-specific integrase n=1 Tax=Halomonas sp. M4R1S46 TaxID=2982692 RepID=UPI0021E429CC|nr:site-specific integrase [Halomonas sp. M4R1S46]UYG06863.1 site-specific integrase [Halomonas sp. M4R1S46]